MLNPPHKKHESLFAGWLFRCFSRLSNRTGPNPGCPPKRGLYGDMDCGTRSTATSMEGTSRKLCKPNATVRATYWTTRHLSSSVEGGNTSALGAHSRRQACAMRSCVLRSGKRLTPQRMDTPIVSRLERWIPYVQVLSGVAWAVWQPAYSRLGCQGWSWRRDYS